MRIVTNKELSSYKVLPFDLYTENKGKILEAGEVLTPGKLIMLKNYIKIYTEDLDTRSYKEKNYELLADIFEKNMDTDLLKKIIEEGIR